MADQLLAWTAEAWNDYLYWQGQDCRTQDSRTLKRLNRLLTDVMRSPFEGIGKPEPLRGDLAAYWSRRIDREHCLVYRVTQDRIVIAQCRYLY